MRFASKEHKAFIAKCLLKPAMTMPIIGHFSMRWEFVLRQDAIFDHSLTSKTAGLTRMVFLTRGRRAVRAACAAWPLTSGTALRRKEKKTVPHPMSCLTAALRPTFLRLSVCVIRNTAGTWSTPCPGFPTNHGNYQRNPERRCAH